MGIVRYRDMLVAVMSSELEMIEGTLQVHVGRRYLREVLRDWSCRNLEIVMTLLFASAGLPKPYHLENYRSLYSTDAGTWSPVLPSTSYLLVAEQSRAENSSASGAGRSSMFHRPALGCVRYL